MCVDHGLWRWYLQLPELQYWWLQVLLSRQTAHHWYCNLLHTQNYDPISFACLQICIHDYPHWSQRCVIFFAILLFFLSEMCPNIGYVLVHDGHPKRCSLDFECISSSGEFSCVKNYCCPKDPTQGKVKQQSVCLFMLVKIPHPSMLMFPN